MSEYHEPWEALSEEVRDTHRALRSLIEEVEAIDWYHQRVATAQDASLREILAHNRDEEIEHACMTLEWLRRRMPGWDEELKTYLFKSAPIVGLEEAEGGADGEPAEKKDPGAPGTSGVDLGIRDLRKESNG